LSARGLQQRQQQQQQLCYYQPSAKLNRENLESVTITHTLQDPLITALDDLIEYLYSPGNPVATKKRKKKQTHKLN